MRKVPGTAMVGQAVGCVRAAPAHSPPRSAAGFRTRAASCPTAPPATKGPTPRGAPRLTAMGTRAHAGGVPQLIPLGPRHGSPPRAAGLAPTGLPPGAGPVW